MKFNLLSLVLFLSCVANCYVVAWEDSPAKHPFAAKVREMNHLVQDHTEKRSTDEYPNSFLEETTGRLKILIQTKR